MVFVVVFGSRVAHCVSETGKATRSGINQGGMRVTCAKRTACKMARFAPTTSKKTAKGERLWFFGELVVFGRACGFLARLWFFGEIVVFWRDCGFLPSLWFLGELVDLRSKVVIKGKPLKDLTTGAKSC